LARPEGFEPPTPRSVVRFAPQSASPAKGKSPFRRASPLFSFGSLSAVLSHCGNNDGNNFHWLCVVRIVSRQAEGEETQPKPHVIVRLWPLNVRNLVCPSLVETFCAARLKHTSPYPARQKRQLGCARPNSALSKVPRIEFNNDSISGVCKFAASRISHTESPE
jgi:hypothetical protein